MNIWERVHECPPAALKVIPAGKLKGKSDINPMWRYKRLTELFGPAGLGWGIEQVNFSVLDGAAGEKIVMCELLLWYQIDGGKGVVPGQGGSMLINTERDRLVSNDEAYKMAYTDAVSVACKQLGFAADIYWANGADSKYSKQTDEDPLGTGNTDKRLPARGDNCEICGATLTAAQKALSKQKFGRLLCPACQTKEGKNET